VLAEYGSTNRPPFRRNRNPLVIPLVLLGTNTSLSFAVFIGTADWKPKNDGGTSGWLLITPESLIVGSDPDPCRIWPSVHYPNTTHLVLIVEPPSDRTVQRYAQNKYAGGPSKPEPIDHYYRKDEEYGRID
jgi:hypothetical protein